MAEKQNVSVKLTTKDYLTRIWKLILVSMKSWNALKAYLRLSPVKTSLMRANLEIAKLDPCGALYWQRSQEFNQAMIELTKARWYSVLASRGHKKAEWQKVFESFTNSQQLADALRSALDTTIPAPVPFAASSLTNNGAEIQFADGVPLVPSINPIVILNGSDFQLGYQYAQQVMQIYGPWIMERKAGRVFSESELVHLHQWEQQLATYAPEIIPLCKGWAKGASDAGVRMSYEDVLEIWCSALPPEKDYMGSGGARMADVPPIGCSGVAAWGRATRDGRLVTGSAGDFDLTYTVTIVAFPESGNNYVFTPFGATGDVPGIGSVNMFGHPGMNNKGLAYVHHGGTPKMIEPKQYWGYGLRRTASVLHILRFADNARQAREMELSYPIGDVGLDSGTVGGFYADSEYGYVMESRKEPVLIREAGTMGETDFLYSANSALHPEAHQAGWMSKPEKWDWHPNGGWRPKEFSFFNKIGMMYSGSSLRSRYFFEMLEQAKGNIDLEYMKTIYRTSGTMPKGDWKKVSRQYRKNGQWGAISGGNASNGVVGVMKPDNGNRGIYALCLGQPARGTAPTSPFFASFNPIYAETNAFWEITLAASPLAVAQTAGNLAADLIDLAKVILDSQPGTYVNQFDQLLDEARNALEEGRDCEENSKTTTGDEALKAIARATRKYTIGQVRARQIINAYKDLPAGATS